MTKALEQYLFQNTRSSSKDSATVPAPKPVTGQEISPEYLDMFLDWYTVEKEGTARQVVAAFFKDNPRISNRERVAVTGFLTTYVDQIRKLSVGFSKNKQAVQALRDERTMNNRIDRTKLRSITELEKYNLAALEVLKTHRLHTSVDFSNIRATADDTASVAIIQVSDMHLNETVDLPNNKYNYAVAAKRLAKFADSCLQHCRTMGATKALVAFTGDLINSDRRPDEVSSQQTGRARAAFVAKDLLQQFLRHLLTELTLTCVSVCGNESRIDKEYGFTDFMLSNNFDLSIYTCLGDVFKDVKGIRFLHNNPYSAIVNVSGHNIMFLHGDSLQKRGDDQLEKKVLELKGMQKEDIRYLIFGHLHSSRIGDTYGRSSSIVGANPYSERALQLASRASQNIYFVSTDGSIDGIKVDLQEADNLGYDFDSALEEYVKSNQGKTAVHQLTA